MFPMNKHFNSFAFYLSTLVTDNILAWSLHVAITIYGTEQVKSCSTCEFFVLMCVYNCRCRFLVLHFCLEATFAEQILSSYIWFILLDNLDRWGLVFVCSRDPCQRNYQLCTGPWGRTTMREFCLQSFMKHSKLWLHNTMPVSLSRRERYCFITNVVFTFIFMLAGPSENKWITCRFV
jgi:hypothetical protein